MKRRSLGITWKMALLSWLAASTTLVVFVIAILPVQKQMLLESLESKARGVAASVHDVTAGAVVNEDYSTVVDHCKEMIGGDESLAYLVITRNDGFSLIHDRQGWRSEAMLAKEWRPDMRTPTGAIGVVPLFQKRVYHYSRPLDYSGIQWGWIHVGLSLESHDRSVALVVRRTILLTVACMVLSLLASVLYATRIVRPIFRLRGVVQRVAGGDLSARAAVDRSDELGSLAGSINSMTEALLRRDRILQSVRFAAQQFLSTSDWKQVIESVLAKLGEAAAVSGIHVFQEAADRASPMVARFSWVAAGMAPLPALPPATGEPEGGATFKVWIDALRRGEMVRVLTSDLTGAERGSLDSRGIRSLLIIPIMVEGSPWGALSFDDRHAERAWTDAELDSLRAATDMFGAAIARQRAQDALIEAKETLELRVDERTRELREQMREKEQAHAALAEAQQQLIETSRQAGMAEVATGVLHNVGNVLNSINVSTTLIREHLSDSEIPSLVRVAGLLDQHAADVGDFLAKDAKGRQVIPFLSHLAAHLSEEHLLLQQEHEQLARNVEHIKEIVAMQQSYARVSGVLEKISLVNLVEDALHMNSAGLSRHGIEVVRQFAQMPTITTDKHKVLQILVNLVHNAKYALDAAPRPDRRITISIRSATGDRARVVVQDNGIGIPAENLTRIFSHGFTTRKGGHGFGLHSGAIAARELGGTLSVQSDGPGQGATFTLELPLQIGRATI